MIRSRWAQFGAIGIFGFAVAIAVALPLTSESQVQAQPPGQGELSDGLWFVPEDAAVFVYADVPKIWDSTILKSVRKADPKAIESITGKRLNPQE